MYLQGRVQVEDRPFSGVGWFKFALLDGSQSVVWHHDREAPAQAEPESALALWVTNGWFEVWLGDTAVSNMAPLAAAVIGSGGLSARIWFDDGAHGSRRLEPDLRFGAVPYAFRALQMPANSISLAHLTPELQARIEGGSVVVTGGVEQAALVLATPEQSSNLVQAGYAAFPAQLAQESWQTEYLDPRLTAAFLSAPGTNLWDGAQWWLWRWGGGNSPGQGARYHPAQGRWTLLPGAGAPMAGPDLAVAAVVNRHLLIVEYASEAWRAVRCHGESNAWEAVAFADAPSWTNRPLALDCGAAAIFLGMSQGRVTGLAYDFAQDQWRTLSTNGPSGLDWAGSGAVPLPDGFLFLGNGPGGLQFSRYRLDTDTWETLSTDGFSLDWTPGLRVVWTGAQWYWLHNSPAGWRGVRYDVAANQWLSLPEDGAPAGHPRAQCLWSGAELVVVCPVSPAGEETVYSARFDPAQNQWRAMNPAAPQVLYAPEPQYVATATELLMVRPSDPSQYAAYHWASDRWRPLNGPTLGFEAALQWTGRQLLCLPLAPQPEQGFFLHLFTPAAPLGIFYKPAP